jgi:hypothetical protein
LVVEHLGGPTFWWYHEKMPRSTRDTTKIRHKRAPEPGTPIMVRLQADALARLDSWINHQERNLTRPEALRRLTGAMLEILAKDPGEKRSEHKKR